MVNIKWHELAVKKRHSHTSPPIEASKLQQRNATKPRVNTARGVPLVGKGKPSLGARKAKQPPGRALTQRGTTQRRPARRRATKGVTAVAGAATAVPQWGGRGGSRGW